MCYSATASFVAGSVLCGVGVTTLRLAPRRRDLPLAAIPLLFGLQQIAEGFVWRGDVTGVREQVGVAGFVFLFHALVLWPTYAPLAAMCSEPAQARRRWMLPFLFIGIAVSCFLGYGLATHGVWVHADAHRLVYRIAAYPSGKAELGYGLAVIVPWFLSSYLLLRVFGGLVFALGVIAAQIELAAFVSVWCFYAALLSMVLLAHFAHARRPAWLTSRA